MIPKYGKIKKRAINFVYKDLPSTYKLLFTNENHGLLYINRYDSLQQKFTKH